ncbi:MAG: helix-turn-helix transcriptional regulator [Anaerolineae bacterium]|nr:helix-turn-helix transcriptional regulator [Anaerolineae bacterium]
MSVRYALLGLIAQQPRHGYELHAAFTALVGGKETWDVKVSQIYTTLARLAEGGLVVEDAIEKDGGPEKRIYAITPSGSEQLRAWFETGVLDAHLHDEFFVKLMVGLTLGEVDARKIIQVQRTALYRELHHITTQRQAVDAKVALAQILLLDKTVMHLEADLRWIEMVEARLDEVRRQPLPQPEPKPRGRPPKK